MTMTLCDEELSGVFADLASRFGWRCQALPEPGVVEVATGRRRADSEPIRLYLRMPDGDTILASDGGDTLTALGDVGFDRDDPLMDGLWQEALRTYRLDELDGRVFLQASVATAAHSLARLADGCLALDALRVVALPPRNRPLTLAAEVEQYLRNVYAEPGLVRKAPQLRLRGGVRVSPAIEVRTPARGQVYVQPGAASSPTQSYDHAYATFALVHQRSDVPITSRLVVLGGSAAAWNLNKLRALADVAFVGFWQDRVRLREFLDGETPDDPLMLPAGVQAALPS